MLACPLAAGFGKSEQMKIIQPKQEEDFSSVQVEVKDWNGEVLFPVSSGFIFTLSSFLLGCLALHSRGSSTRKSSRGTLQ